MIETVIFWWAIVIVILNIIVILLPDRLLLPKDPKAYRYRISALGSIIYSSLVLMYIYGVQIEF